MTARRKIIKMFTLKCQILYIKLTLTMSEHNKGEKEGRVSIKAAT
jgi:hypothetical protein